MNFKDFLKKYSKILIVVLLLAISFPLSTNLLILKANYFPTNFDRSLGLQIFTELIGEIRTILASYIFIRADMYHHEREDKINWRKDKVTLPLHRLVTALNPHKVSAYDFGAYHLAVNFKKPKEAVKFLREGLKYNPKSFQLYFTMGEIFYVKGDYEGAIRYFNEAFKLAHNKVDVKNALRRLYWCNRKIKRYDKALEDIKMWRNLDPKDPILPRFAKEVEKLKSGEKTEADFNVKKISEKERLKKEQEAIKHIHKDHKCHHKHNH